MVVEPVLLGPVPLGLMDGELVINLSMATNGALLDESLGAGSIGRGVPVTHATNHVTLDSKCLPLKHLRIFISCRV